MANENNKSNEKSIDEILREFQAQNNDDNNGKNEVGAGDNGADFPAEPKSDVMPIEKDARQEDFLLPPEKSLRQKSDEAKENADESSADDESKKTKRKIKIKKKDKSENQETDKEKKPKPALKIKAPSKENVKKFAKILACVILAAAVIAGAAFGISRAVKSAKTAYLKPYVEKYPDVAFPDGIQEKYCDLYGANPNTTGYLTVDDIKLNTAVLKESDGSDTPYGAPVTDGCEVYNYVVYLNDTSLEALYSTADGYNSSSGFMTYSDLVSDYTFKVVGAFYTNTVADDDGGYIFPYNVTEEQTAKSAAQFIDRLQNRFIYSTGITLTRSDKLLTISCPTDFHENFRFVIVGVMRDDSEKLTATAKDKSHYPQVIYDEKNEENPYRLASKWYPEIVVRSQSSDGTQTTKTIKKSIKDYQ